MTFSYRKLWVMLEEKNMIMEELRKTTGISSATLAKIGKNETINMNSIGKICKALKCDVGDIVNYQEGEED